MAGRGRGYGGPRPPQGGSEPPQNPVNISELPIRSRGLGQDQPPGSRPESSTRIERRPRHQPGPHSNFSGSSDPEVIFLDAKSLTMASLPEVEYEDDRCTQSSAIHSHLTFCATLRRWNDFPHEVRNVFNEIFGTWDESQSNKLSVELKDPSANAIVNEHYLCGEELSSSGRYVQHVLHVMSAVGKELGIDLQFGDWYTSFERGESGAVDAITTQMQGNSEDGASEQGTNRRRKVIIPDYALLAEEKHEQTGSFARALGEAKSPYKAHDFLSWLQNARGGNDQKLRKLFGQVANYMWFAGLKYAFVTNYTTTIFLKRVHDEQGPILYYSDGISRESRSIPSNSVRRTRSASPSQAPQVSVRECMLFLQRKIQCGDWEAPRRGDRAAWIKEVPKKPKPQQKPQSGNLSEDIKRARHPGYGSSQTSEGMAPPAAPQAREKSPRERSAREDNAQEDSTQEQRSRNKGKKPAHEGKGKNKESPPGGSNRQYGGPRPPPK